MYVKMYCSFEMIILLPRDSLDSQFISFLYLVWLLASKKREVRTCASLCDRSLHLDHPLHLVRHLHIISLSQNTKTRWAGPQPVKPSFVTLTYGSRTANRTHSLYQQSAGQLGTLIGENPLLLPPANSQASTGPQVFKITPPVGVSLPVNISSFLVTWFPSFQLNFNDEG